MSRRGGRGRSRGRSSRAGAARSRGRARGSATGGVTSDLRDAAARAAGVARKEAAAFAGALEAEYWASSISSTWWADPLLDLDLEEPFGLGLVDALERAGDRGALAALRALAAVAPGRVAPASGEAAERLASAGVEDPAWVGQLGGALPTEACLIREEVFDDGVNVFVELEQADGERHAVGVYVDHNLGGIAKDLLVAGSLAEIAEQAELSEWDLTLEPISLKDAAARMSEALMLADLMLDPPVSDEFRPLRALVDARLRALPADGEAPERAEVPTQERDRLVAGFLRSREGRPFRDDPEAADIVELAIDFCADYVDGRPLRWSPVVVELFMTSWLPRKAAREPGFFERVPEVLAAWVRYAGRRRRIPAGAMREVVDSVPQWTDDMLEAVGDESAWGPAKAFAMAAQDAGVDLSDPAELERFVDRYNAGLAAEDRAGEQ